MTHREEISMKKITQEDIDKIAYDFRQKFWYSKRNGVRMDSDDGGSRFAKEEDVLQWVIEEIEIILNKGKGLTG